MPLFSRWNVAGVWVGEYAYDPSPVWAVLPPPCPFHLTLAAGWFGRITGSVHDSAVGGPPESADVRGRLTGTRLTFLKQYPVFTSLDDDGRLVTLREHLARQGYDAAPAVLPNPVHYSGEYDPRAEAIRGRWHLDTQHVYFRHNGQQLYVTFPGTTGTWSAERRDTAL